MRLKSFAIAGLWSCSIARAGPAHLAGVKVGDKFEPQHWTQMDDGAYVRKANVGGVVGLVSATPCNGIVWDLSFLVSFTNAPRYEPSIVPTATPHETATNTRETLAKALGAAGYAPDSGTLWSKVDADAVIQRRYLGEVSCQAVDTLGMYGTCQVMLLAVTEGQGPCTEGL